MVWCVNESNWDGLWQDHWWGHYHLQVEGQGIPEQGRGCEEGGKELGLEVSEFWWRSGE